MMTFGWSALVLIKPYIIYALLLPQPVCNAAGLWGASALPSPPPTGHKVERELKPSLEALGKHRLGDYFGET